MFKWEKEKKEILNKEARRGLERKRVKYAIRVLKKGKYGVG
jgi:hypothetical protein